MNKTRSEEMSANHLDKSYFSLKNQYIIIYSDYIPNKERRERIKTHPESEGHRRARCPLEAVSFRVQPDLWSPGLPVSPSIPLVVTWSSRDVLVTSRPTTQYPFIPVSLSFPPLHFCLLPLCTHLPRFLWSSVVNTRNIW